jgi:hypothetical protein
VRIRQLVTVPDGVFDQASVDNAIFCFEKCSNKEARENNEAKFVEARAGEVELTVTNKSTAVQSIFHDTPGKIFRPPRTSDFPKLELKFFNKSKPLGELARVNFGMQLRDRKKFPGDVIDANSSGKPKAPYRPCLTGKNINRYSTDYTNLYCFFDRSAQQGGCWDEAIQFAKSKVIVRQIGEVPIASFDNNGYCCLNTVFMVKPTVPNLEEKFLLGILNSKSISFISRNKFSDFKETFPKIKGSYLQQLPIPSYATASEQLKVSNLVDKLLTLVPRLRAAKSDHERQTLQNAVTATDQQIDALDYELYGLTEQEIKNRRRQPMKNLECGADRRFHFLCRAHPTALTHRSIQTRANGTPKCSMINFQ